MRSSLDHAATLRAVGQVFDADAARNIAVQEDSQAVSLWWGAGGGPTLTARYPWAELQTLQDAAKAARGAHRDERVTIGAPWSELLRTLGQDLDELGAERSTVVGDVSSLTASWIRSGRFDTRQYATRELWELSRSRAARRQSNI
jgi:hypothetical protein